jgi:la-related protein 1
MVPRYLTDSSRIHRLPSQEQLTFPNGPRQNGVFFLKDGVSQSDFDREGSDPWPYEALHAKALEQRARGLHGADNHEMEILYQFWPTFLFQNFNLAMYNDFYRFALEDLDHRSTNGSKHLADYYGYRLAADKALPDQIAQDIVAAMGLEKGEAKPIFQKVRAFWRDGSFNFKSRKRINDRLNAWVKEELAK